MNSILAYFSLALDPRRQLRWLQRYLPVLAWFTGFLLLTGLWSALYLAPADYQQGEGYRIIFIHVPSAYLSLLAYAMLSFAALLSLVFRLKLGLQLIDAVLPLGTMFTFLALITGALWGKPMWGTWWVWDARLTSELILLLWYLLTWSCQHAFGQTRGGQQALAILILIGSLNLPIIHYSVQWWQTLHQGSTLNFSQSMIATNMLYPLLLMIIAVTGYFMTLVFARLRTQLIMSFGGKSDAI